MTSTKFSILHILGINTKGFIDVDSATDLNAVSTIQTNGKIIMPAPRIKKACMNVLDNNRLFISIASPLHIIDQFSLHLY